MKKFINSKILMVGIAVVFAFVSAQNSASVNFVGQTKVKNVGSSSEFVDKGSSLDTMKISFKAVVDNVTAQIGFKNTDDAGSGIKFDYAHLTVADLFNGILTVKAFDIGYDAGFNQAIRPDFGSQGLKFTIKPIDMLSIAVGYGIGQRDFFATAPTFNPSFRGVYSNVQYHAVQLDVGINNAFVPVTIYGGAVIIDGDDIQQPKEAGGSPETVKVYHASAGFTADLLAALMAGALKLDLGVVLPIDGAATSFSYENELNMVAVLHGSADIAAGFGLGYNLGYALDTDSKLTTLGDLDNSVDSDAFFETFRIEAVPSYTIGQFKIAFSALFGMIGEKTASMTAKRRVLARLNSVAPADLEATLATIPTTTAPGYNALKLTPSVTWSPGGENSVKLYFEYEKPNLDEDADIKTLGMDVSMTIGVEGL